MAMKKTPGKKTRKRNNFKVVPQVSARCYCSQFGGGLFSALFGITFAIVPEVSITLVMQ